MMNDIVERIRMRRLPVGGTFELMDDSADEIERLRAALVEIERLGWKEVLGDELEHTIALHYKIRGIARDALKQCA